MKRSMVVFPLVLFTLGNAIPAQGSESAQAILAARADDAAGCGEHATLVCVEERCACATLRTRGAPRMPGPQCMLVVGYDQGRPEKPWVQFGSSVECAAHAEVALAVALAELLRTSGPAIPVPKN